MSDLFSTDELAAVRKAILSRRTWKVLADEGAAVDFDAVKLATFRQLVRDAVSIADNAPFHYDRGADGVAQPWRVDILWHDACREVASHFFEWAVDVKPGNKLPAMLNACGACVLVSWLPQFHRSSDVSIDVATDIPKPKQIQIDREHAAATSAFVENLLLMLTASNLGTYWASGNPLCGSRIRKHMGVSDETQLSAAVFVDFSVHPKADAQTASDIITRLPGKLAGGRAPIDRWCREIEAGAMNL